MPTATAPTLVSLERYLHTRYRPDRDFVRGRIERRNLGEYDHNLVQKAVLMRFSLLDKQRGTRTIQEQRTRMSRLTSTASRISAWCREARPVEQIFTEPQLIAIEVLSPEDRKTRMQERLDDYRNFGIPNIWVIDPRRKIGWNCSSGEWIETERFAVDGWDITLSLPEFFAQLADDEA